MKRGCPESPKFRRLCRELELPAYAAAGVLELLWHFCARFTPAGDVGKYTDADLAEAIGWRGEPEVLIGALVSCGWFDRDAKYRLVVHDWAEHADQTTRRWLAKRGLAFAVPSSACASSPVIPMPARASTELAHTSPQASTELARASSPEPEPEPEPEPAPAPAPAARALHASTRTLKNFETWWTRYPHKLHHQLAFQTWISLDCDKHLEEIDACMGRFEASDLWKRRVYQFPERWLSDCARDSWESSPAPATGLTDAVCDELDREIAAATRRGG